MGCKWLYKRLSSFCLVWTAYLSGQSCPWFSNNFTGHMPVKLLPASFCQFTCIPLSKSVIQKWDIKSQRSQWGICKSAQNVCTESQRLLGYIFYKDFFQDISCIFYLLSRTVYEILHYLLCPTWLFIITVWIRLQLISYDLTVCVLYWYHAFYDQCTTLTSNNYLITVIKTQCLFFCIIFLITCL